MRLYLCRVSCSCFCSVYVGAENKDPEAGDKEEDDEEDEEEEEAPKKKKKKIKHVVPETPLVYPPGNLPLFHSFSAFRTPNISPRLFGGTKA